MGRDPSWIYLAHREVSRFDSFHKNTSAVRAALPLTNTFNLKTSISFVSQYFLANNVGPYFIFVNIFSNCCCCQCWRSDSSRPKHCIPNFKCFGTFWISSWCTFLVFVELGTGWLSSHRLSLLVVFDWLHKRFRTFLSQSNGKAINRSKKKKILAQCLRLHTLSGGRDKQQKQGQGVTLSS